jgi:hypothetical protein
LLDLVRHDRDGSRLNPQRHHEADAAALEALVQNGALGREQLLHRLVVVLHGADEGADALASGQVREVVDQRAADAAILFAVRDDQRALGSWSGLALGVDEHVAGHGDDPVVVLFGQGRDDADVGVEVDLGG